MGLVFPHIRRETRNHQTFHNITDCIRIYVFNVLSIELSFVNTASVTVEFDNCNVLNNQCPVIIKSSDINLTVDNTIKLL